VWQVDNAKGLADGKEDAKWLNYDTDLQYKMWNRFDENPEKPLEVNTKDWKVVIDFKALTQTNRTTGKIRAFRMQRKIDTPEWDPIPPDAITFQKRPEEEKVPTQIAAYQMHIARIGRALDAGPDDENLRDLGGASRAIEICADKMVKLSKLENPKHFTNYDDRVRELREKYYKLAPLVADKPPADKPPEPRSSSAFDRLKDDRNIGARNIKADHKPIENDVPSDDDDQDLKEQFNDMEIPDYLPCFKARNIHSSIRPKMTSEDMMSICCSRPREHITMSACCRACFNDDGHTEECDFNWANHFPSDQKHNVEFWMRKHLAGTRKM
jgi:hypothetical protein